MAAVRALWLRLEAWGVPGFRSGAWWKAAVALVGYALILLLAAAALPAPWASVDLEVVDAHPSAAGAMRAATARRPEDDVGPYGSGTAAAALGATRRAVWNHGGAAARLRRPAFAHALNVVAPAASGGQPMLRLVKAGARQAARTERAAFHEGGVPFA